MQRTVTYLLLLCFCWTFSFSAHAEMKFKQELEALISGLEPASFIREFPYQAFLEKVPLSEVSVLEWYRQELLAAELPATDWLFNLGEHWLLQDSLQLTDLRGVQERVRLGALLLDVPKVLGQDAGIYEAVGDLLLTDAAQFLEDALQAEQLDKKDPGVLYLVNRLEESGYILDIPMSSWEKFWLNAKAGRWGYIWSRVYARYFTEFLIGMGLIIALPMVVLVVRRRKRRKIRYSNSTTHISTSKQETYEPI